MIAQSRLSPTGSFRVPAFQTLSETRSRLYQRRFLCPGPHFSALIELHIVSFALNQISAIFHNPFHHFLLDTDKFWDNINPNSYFAWVKEVVCTVDLMQAVIHWLLVGFLHCNSSLKVSLIIFVSIWPWSKIKSAPSVLTWNFQGSLLYFLNLWSNLL